MEQTWKRWENIVKTTDTKCHKLINYIDSTGFDKLYHAFIHLLVYPTRYVEFFHGRFCGLNLEYTALFYSVFAFQVFSVAHTCIHILYSPTLETIL